MNVTILYIGEPLIDTYLFAGKPVKIEWNNLSTQ